MKTVLELFYEEYQTDDGCNWVKESKDLLAKFEKGSEEVKAAINDVFMTLCGWTLTTLIGKVRAANEQAKKDALEMAENDDHICICQSCAEGLFGLPEDHDFSQGAFRLEGGFDIDNNCCDGWECEIDGCDNENVDYTLNYTEADAE